MPLTLRELVGDRGLGITTCTTAPETSISWVHTSELADPTPFLEGGELLLTTGLSLRSEACGEFVERLVGVGVAGLGFGVGLSHDAVPEALVSAARRAGLPLLVVPRATPFIAISKAVSRAIAADEYAALRRTSSAQHELARVAGRVNGLAALIRKLAKLLDAWVVLLDRSASTLHAAPVAAAGRITMLAADLDRLRGKKGLAAAGASLEGDEVSMQALGGRARGFLVVGRSDPFGTSDHHVINSAASLLTLALEQAEVLHAARRHLRAGFLRLMVRGEPVREGLGELRSDLPAEPLRVAVLRSGKGPGELLTALESERPVGTLYLAEHDNSVVALAADDDGAVAWLRQWVTHQGDVCAGVSQPCELGTIAKGLRQAQQAVDVAPRGSGALVGFEDVGGSGLLSLVAGSDAQAFAESLLDPLLEDDVLVSSLREWLAHHGQWDPAAGRLGVHRHTMRNRVRRIEERLGRSVDQPGVRAELWLALQIIDRARG